ncbi:uncharacterized protein LOC133744183 [Rosa rugosa]|uniref:uncharacterized protein LOC133744183 n=1 Tax=Rosa rugosa TaxID=74645 RepID=UPI002B412A0A|nr:uncharacterized protein LOC133744183 [Rosa rugosa]
MLRLIKWSPEFSPSTYKNTFAQVWVRFWDLGFAYWDQQTLFEIASGIGTPLKLDPRTMNRTVGLFARILVDVDFSQPPHDKLRITRANGEVVVIGVEYESVPDICTRCGIVGHVAGTCRSKASVDTVAAIPNERGRSTERSDLKRRRNNRPRKSQHNSKHGGAIRRPVRPRQPEVSPRPATTTAKLRHDFDDTMASPVLNNVEIFPAALSITAIPAFTATPVLDEPVMPAVPVQHSDSSDSVPPGFTRMETEFDLQPASSTSTPVVSSVAPPIIMADCNQSDYQMGVRTDLLEEGEFTPVLHKKSKKLLKQK